MTDINNVIVVGRLIRDGEITYSQNGMAILNFSVAVNESYKENEQWIDRANFFNVTLFGKTAENIKLYITKGKQVIVNGHLQQQRWKDSDGHSRSNVIIVAERVQLVGSKNENENIGFTEKKEEEATSNAYDNQQGDRIPF